MIQYEVFVRGGRDPRDSPVLRIQPASGIASFSFRVYSTKELHLFKPQGRLYVKNPEENLSAISEKEISSAGRNLENKIINVFLDLLPSEKNEVAMHVIQGLYHQGLHEQRRGIIYQAKLSDDSLNTVELHSPFDSGSANASFNELISFGGLYSIEAKSNEHLFYRVKEEFPRIAKKAEKIISGDEESNALLQIGGFLHNQTGENSELVLLGNLERI